MKNENPKFDTSAIIKKLRENNKLAVGETNTKIKAIIHNKIGSPITTNKTNLKPINSAANLIKQTPFDTLVPQKRFAGDIKYKINKIDKKNDEKKNNQYIPKPPQLKKK